VDLSVSCLVVDLVEFVGVLESAFMGEAQDTCYLNTGRTRSRQQHPSTQVSS
jgi:hypothetical protein